MAELDNNSDLVGVLMPYLVPKMNSQLLAGIQDELTKNKLDLLLLSSRHAKLDVLYESIKKNKVANLIVNPSSADLGNIDFINFMHKLSDDGVNIVIIDIPVPGLKANYIGFENTSAFKLLTQQLINQGAKDIIVVGKFDSKVYSSRLKGIRSAIDNKKIKLQQIDINDNSLLQTAVKIADSEVDSVILCDAGSSVNLSYELRNVLGQNIKTIKIGGIVEQDEHLPITSAVTLEKQAVELGKVAVKMLFHKKEIIEIKLLSIKILS